MSEHKTLEMLDNKTFFYKKGLCGLTNLGNTCFMNTIIQCLNNTLEFSKYFISDSWKEDINEEKKDKHLVEQWVHLCKGLWYKNAVITPTSFHRIVQITAISKGYPEFSGFSQNDSQEFLQFFLECMHNGLSREVIMNVNGEVKCELDKMELEATKQWIEYFKNDYSPIVELFYGQLYSKITNDKNNDKSEIYEPFSNLALEIPDKKGNITIYDCLNNFCNPEEVPDFGDTDKKYHKSLSLWKTPKHLVVFFKRFDNMGRKKDEQIKFPINNLNLGKYVLGYDQDDSIYDLYAISNHIGGLMGGHYYAYVKNSDNNWYKYNDKYVSSLEESDLITPEAYCLFYKKK
jgi:ubiquitin C-terminal hydrolase